jgi:hypothetical protein
MLTWLTCVSCLFISFRYSLFLFFEHVNVVVFEELKLYDNLWKSGCHTKVSFGLLCFCTFIYVTNFVEKYIYDFD